MKRFVSVIIVLCMVFMSVIPCTSAAAALTSSDIQVSELIFVNDRGMEISYLSRYTDQFDLTVILENEVSADTVATLESCCIYNNSTSTLNNNVKVTFNNSTRKSEFTFKKLKYSGAGSILKFSLSTQNGTTGALSNTIYINKTIDVLETDYSNMYLEPALILDGYTTGSQFISAGKSFTLKFSIRNLAEVEAEQTQIEIKDSDQITLKEGSKTIGLGTIKAHATKSYWLQFEVPRNVSKSTQKLDFTMSYVYNGGEDLGTVTGTKDFSISLAVEKIESLSIANIEAPDTVYIGQEIPVSFSVVNSGYTSYDNASYTITDSTSKEYASGYIGAIALTASTEVTAKLKALSEIGNKTFTVTVKYDSDNGLKKSIAKSFTISAKDSTAVSLSNIDVPYFVTNQENKISFKIINMGKESFVNGQAFLRSSDNKLLSSVYFGEIGSQNQTSVEVPVTLQKIGTDKSVLEVTYETQSGIAKSVKQTLSVTVTKSSELRMQRLNYPEEFVVGQSEEIVFDIVNTSIETFYNAEVYFLDEAGKTLSSAYQGEIAPRSQTEIKLPLLIKKSGKQKINVLVKYENAALDAMEIKDTLSLNVKASNEITSAIKVQSIDIPVKATINAKIDIPFAVTNPQAEAVTGAEGFLIDADGNELDSIYIGKLDPQTSGSYSLSASYKEIGTRFLTVKITYTDSESKQQSTSRGFNLTVVSDEDDGTTSNKPANLKIQKLSVPMQIFCDVKTEVTFTLVNAGKGTASNAEVYVMCNGEEIARDYIGNIEASGSIDGKTYVRFAELGEYPLEIFVDYTNADESVSTASKTADTKVVQYRASVKDITGYEYLMVGYEGTIEFTFLNAGTQNLYNVTGLLVDENENQIASVYIGNVESGVEKARQRIKVNMFEAGTFPYILRVTYENTDMQEFTIDTPISINVQEQFIDDGGWGEMPVTMEETGEAAAEGGINWLLWIGIGVGVVAIAVVVIVIIVKKRKAKQDDDDDMEFFTSQIAAQNQSKSDDTIKK